MRSDIPISFSDRIDFDQFPVSEVLVLSLSALLWLVLFEGWLPELGPPPAGFDAPMDAPGAPEVTALSNGFTGIVAYLSMWGTMMLAMMLPSLLPIVGRYRQELCDAPSTFGPSIGAFLGGYGLAWTLVGTVPLAAEYLLTTHTAVTASAGAGGRGALPVAVLFAFAGAYQLTSSKQRLLVRCDTCQSIRHRPSIRRMVRNGLEYAIGCIGCTWPLFALMVALGSMNYLVMLGLTLVVSVERLAPDGENVAIAWGVILLAAAGFAFLFGVPAPVL